MERRCHTTAHEGRKAVARLSHSLEALDARPEEIWVAGERGDDTVAQEREDLRHGHATRLETLNVPDNVANARLDAVCIEHTPRVLVADLDG